MEEVQGEQPDNEKKELRKDIERQVSRDRFMRVYLSDIKGLLLISSNAEYQILFNLWASAKHNSNEVNIVKYHKEKLAKKLGFKYGYVCNCIKSLTKKDILIRKGKGVYILNPNFFFLGDDIARVDTILLALKYGLNNKTTE